MAVFEHVHTFWRLSHYCKHPERQHLKRGNQVVSALHSQEAEWHYHRSGELSWRWGCEKAFQPPSFKHSFSLCPGRRNSPDVTTFVLTMQVSRIVRNKFLFYINYSAVLVIYLTVVTKYLTRSSLKEEG